MQYSREGTEVTVKFSIREYAELMGILGFALLVAEGEPRISKIKDDIGAFIEKMNKDNPDYDLLLKVADFKAEVMDGNTKAS